MEILKEKELTKREAKKLGFDITEVFLEKCDLYGVLIYESDDLYKKKYGVLKRG